MNPEPDKGMRSFMEEIGDAMRYSPNSEYIRRPKASPDSKPKRRTLIFWVLAILVLIANIAVFFRDGNRPSSEEFNTIKERLNQLENKLLTSLDDTDQKITRLESLLNRLQQSVTKLNRPVSAMTDKRRHYEVRRGDSLSLIAQKYGITVNAVAPNAATRGRRIDFGEREIPKPEDVAPIVVFLATDAAASINGCIFDSFGGEIALYNHPAPVKSIYKEGRWTLDELLKIIPTTLAAGLVNPAPPGQE